MAKVTGIGGVFLTSPDPAALAAWYRTHLGIDVQAWNGTTFPWHTPAAPEPHGATVWCVQPRDWPKLNGSRAPFMINYRVDDLAGLLANLRAAGCAVDAETSEDVYGKFGWVTDPDGNKLELWQPPAGPLPG